MLSIWNQFEPPRDSFVHPFEFKSKVGIQLESLGFEDWSTLRANKNQSPLKIMSY
jgi:hypothetical protein